MIDARWLLAGLLACAAVSTWAQAQADSQPWTPAIKVTRDYASGNYGTSTTSITRTTAATVSLDGESYAFDLDLPYLEQSGPSRLVSIGGRRRVLTATAGQSANGIGDATVGATRYMLNQETSGFDLDLGATLKLPTASASKGLGTGKTDLSLQTTLGRSWGSLSGNATAGYTLVGKPAGQDLRNTAFGSLDLSYKIDGKTRFGATYSAASALASGTSGLSDFLVYAERRLTDRLRLDLSVGHGFSSQSPQRSLGISASLSL